MDNGAATSARVPMKMWRLAVNICLTAALLCLMPYSRIGEQNHEILGVAMFALFIVHHILNRKWLGALAKGRYGALRICQTALVFLLVFSVMASVVSGIIVSNHLFYPLTSGVDYGIFELAKGVHMVSAHANYVLMSLHLGLHWGAIAAAARGSKKEITSVPNRILWVAAAAIALYGAYAFVKRHIGDYLLLRAHFLLLDAAEPLAFFFLDYLAIMVLFVFIGYCAAKLLKRVDRQSA